MKRKTKKYPSAPLIGCVRCGESKAETEFYTNRWSRVYASQKQVPLCKDCVQALLEEYTYKYGEEAALFLICAVLDIPYSMERYKQIAETTPQFTFGRYIRQLQMNQFRNQSFAASVTTGDFPDLGQAAKVSVTSERLNRLQKDVSTLREELLDIRAKLAESGNIHKSANDSVLRE
ncbi:MAG: hypothetical protein HDT42_02735 [Ruminococcaceae bacterium]|nr:hypothetical protein [Oscillospiraceae bacterium]